MRRGAWTWTIALAPFVLLCALIVTWHNTVPIYDGWQIPQYLQLLEEGRLGFDDFWAPYNGHRAVFPRLILIGMDRATGAAQFPVVVLNLMIGLATFALLVHLIAETVQPRVARVAAVAAASAVVFSPVAWENWLWSLELCYFLTNAGVVLAVTALTGFPRLSERVRFALAIAGAVVATLSLAHGALAWIVCLPVFFARREWRSWAKWWIVALLAMGAAFAFSYTTPPGARPFDAPGELVRYILTFLARPLSYEGQLGVVVAVAVFAAVALAARGVVAHARTNALPWLLLMLFGVLAAGVTAAGRAASFGAAQANASRYTTVSGLALVGLLVLLVQTFTRAEAAPSRTLVGATGAVLALLVAFNYVDGVREMERHYSEIMVPTRDCARHAASPADPCVAATGLESVWPSVEFLRSRGWGGL